MGLVLGQVVAQFKWIYVRIRLRAQIEALPQEDPARPDLGAHVAHIAVEALERHPAYGLVLAIRQTVVVVRKQVTRKRAIAQFQ